MKKEIQEIVKYYDALAPDYDAARLKPSYGRYYDAQETAIMRKQLQPFAGKRILELGCGTGRFLGMASSGIDFSLQMLKRSRLRYPQKPLCLASAHEIPFANETYDVVFCVRVIMHLPKEFNAQIFDECARILKPGGVLIFDFPSALRRKLTRSERVGWHVGTAYRIAELKQTLGEKWRFKSIRGAMFFPIHRIPGKFRFLFLPLEKILGFLFASFSAYCFVVLEKKPA